MNRLNLLLVASIAAGGILSLWLEGYLTRVSWAFALYTVVICVTAGWFAARAISTRRLLGLAIVAGAESYVTQYVGATLGGIWRYPPPHQTYYFVPAAFILVATVAYGLVVEILAPRLRQRLPLVARWANWIPVIMLAAVATQASRPYRDGQGVVFWLYYGAMFATALYFAIRMDLATLLALLGSAILLGFCSESLGAHSGLWTFDNRPDWLPPLWLILGSWPLEFMMYFALSEAALRRTRLADRETLDRAASAQFLISR